MASTTASAMRGRRAWTVPMLIRHALRTKDERSAWQCVTLLHLRGTREVFIAAAQLCRCADPRKRRLGADILGQLGTPKRPFRKESLPILHSMLHAESRTKVLNSVLTALGHCQEKDDRHGLTRICVFQTHRSAAVRFGLIMALLGRTEKISLDTLISLSDDKSAEVRDWATFGLGTMIEIDSPKIRDALAKRLADRHYATKCEAIAGLAKRKDDRGKKALVRELKRTNPPTLLFEAAANLAAPIPEPQKQKRFRAALREGNRRYGKTLKRLAD